MAYSNIPVGVLFAMQAAYTPFEMELFTGIQESPPASEFEELAAYSFVTGIMGLPGYQDVVIDILESKKRHPAPEE